MLYSRSRTRQRLARKLSWLIIASLTSVALFASAAPGAGTSYVLALVDAAPLWFVGTLIGLVSPVDAASGPMRSC